MMENEPKEVLLNTSEISEKHYTAFQRVYYTVSLIFGIMFAAMAGPFSQFMNAENAMLRSTWRFQGSLLLLIIICTLMRCCGMLNFDASKFKKLHINFWLFMTSLGQFFTISFLMESAKYLVMAHTQMIVGLSGTLIGLLRLLTCKKLTQYEVVGTFIAITGAIVAAQDPSAEKVVGNISQEDKLYGYAMAFCSAIASASFFYAIGKIAKEFPPVITATAICGYECLTGLILIPWIAGPGFEISADPYIGYFGCWREQNIVYNLLVMSLLNGLGFTLGMAIAGQYFSPMILGNCVLLYPLFAQIYGVALGLDQPPGFLTYLGFGLTVGGILLTQYKMNMKK